MMNRRFFLVGATALAGCSTTGLATRSALAPGTIAWFDLVTDSFDQSREFYSGLFGWEVTAPDSSGYAIIRSGDTALGGIADVGAGPPDQTGAQWVPVLTVPDVAAAVATAKAAGGSEVLAPKTTQDGDFATIRDNRGALVTLYTGPLGFPLERVGEENLWIWVDLFTDNSKASRGFYEELIGFETRKEGDLVLFTKDGQERAGLVEVSRSDSLPTWLPFVAVADIDATVARSRQLGGGPLTVSDDAAIILDTRGGAIGIALGGE